MPWYALVCFGMLWYALVCFGMLWYALVCFVMLCYALVKYFKILCVGKKIREPLIFHIPPPKIFH